MQPVTIEVSRRPPLHPIRRVANLHPAVNEITIEIEPPMGVRLWLAEKDNPAPLAGATIWYALRRIRVRSAAPDARPEFPQASEIEPSGVLVIEVGRPGRCEIQLPKIEGYQAPPPFTVEVTSGAFVEHRVILERERVR